MLVIDTRPDLPAEVAVELGTGLVAVSMGQG
jgi:hypothetical protein